MHVLRVSLPALLALAKDGATRSPAAHAAFLSSASFVSPGTSQRPPAFAAPAPAHDTNWTPRSRFRADDNFFKKERGLQIGIDLDKYLLETASASHVNEGIVTDTHRDRKGNVIAVEVASALSEHDALTVRALSKCIRDSSIGKYQFENRSFGNGKSGENDCTYLTPMLQIFLIAPKCYELRGSHGRLDPGALLAILIHSVLGIRTSEHLSYKGWRQLKPHKDKGSVFTVVVSIAGPQDYTGGEFFVRNSMWKSTDIKPDRFSAIVFLSKTTHGVRPITPGHRETFVTELWINDDSPLGMNRPSTEEWKVLVDCMT